MEVAGPEPDGPSAPSFLPPPPRGEHPHDQQRQQCDQGQQNGPPTPVDGGGKRPDRIAQRSHGANLTRDPRVVLPHPPPRVTKFAGSSSRNDRSAFAPLSFVRGRDRSIAGCDDSAHSVPSVIMDTMTTISIAMSPTSPTTPLPGSSISPRCGRSRTAALRCALHRRLVARAGADPRALAIAVLAPLVTAVAYVCSELLKSAVDEERPCRAVAGAVASIVECPAYGDWSFPSNHSTIAGAAAVPAWRSPGRGSRR